MPADFFCKAGDSSRSFVQALSYTDGSIPSMVSGTAAAWTIRSLTSALPITITGTVTIVSAASGIVAWTPSAADTAVPGNYMANWVITFPGGKQDTFPADGYLWVEIQPSLATEQQQLVGLPDVKEYLGMDHNQHDRDHELLAMIEGMRPQVEQITGPIILRTFDEQYDGGQNIISLRNRPNVGFGTSPILTLIGAMEYRGAIEYPMSLVANPTLGSIYSAMLDDRTGTVTRRTAGGGVIAWFPGRQSVRIVYQAGQQTVPANVRLACLEIIRVNFRTTAPAGRGRMSEADIETASEKLPFGISKRAREMLAPTRKAPAFA